MKLLKPESCLSGVRWRECEITDCARRNFVQLVFGQGFDSPRLHHLITHVLIQGMGDSFCICKGIKRQITGIICYILPYACKKSDISRHFAEWELSQSSLFASNPGHFFSKAPAVSAKMHPLWTIWAKRP